MNEKVNFDLKSLQLIFNKNKSYLIPVVIMFSSIILFIQFVIPQFGVLNKARNDGNEAVLKLKALKENYNILKNTDETVLDSQLKILSLALPLSKDFSGILNSIYYASQKSEAILGPFSFTVGDLSKSDGDIAFPVIEVSIPVNSDISIVNNFAETISKTVPLSEIKSMKIGNTSSVVNILFYYRPLDTSGYSINDRISPVSQRGILLIDELTGFGNTSLQ